MPLYNITVNVKRRIVKPSFVNVRSKGRHTSHVSNRKDGTIPTNLHQSPIRNVGYPKVNVRTIVVDVVVAAVVVEDGINQMLVLRVEVWPTRASWMLRHEWQQRQVVGMEVVVSQARQISRYRQVVQRGREREGRGVEGRERLERIRPNYW